MSYSVLALDLSMTSSGWAHFAHGDKFPTWGLRTGPSWNDDEGEHLWNFFEWLGHKCTDLKVTHIFVEDSRFKYKHEETLSQLLAAIGLMGQAAIVAYLLTKRGQPVEFQSVSPINWRKVFLGAMHKPQGIDNALWRKMLKEAAIAECAKRNWIVEKDDEADALGVLTFGICSIDPRFRLFQSPMFNRAEADLENKVRELR